MSDPKKQPNNEVLNIFSLIDAPISNGFLRSVVFDVFALGRKYLEVFDSVIKSIPVNMVDYFLSRQKSPQVFFHYQSMLGNISFLTPKWVMGLINIKIAAIFRASVIVIPPRISAFLRAKNRLLITPVSKFFFTNNTISKRFAEVHATSHTAKPSFIVTVRKFFFTIRTDIIKHKLIIQVRGDTVNV